MWKVMIKKQKKIKTTTYMPYLCLAPMMIFLITFSGWPFFEAVKTSFFKSDGMILGEFVGLQNYIDILFHDRIFWISMKNLFFLFCAMNVCFVSPIIFAKLTHMLSNERLKFFIRSAFTITTVVPTIITMMLWKFIYYPNIGLVARIVQFFGGKSPNLLGDEKTVLFAIFLIGFPWINGLSFLMYYAKLQSIDSAVLEAAEIDGASEWQKFIKIELPEMKSLIISFYVIALIGQFHDYEKILILTDGGPGNASLTPALYMFQRAFGDEPQFGYACAIAMILFICTFIISRVLQKGDDES